MITRRLITLKEDCAVLASEDTPRMFMTVLECLRVIHGTPPPHLSPRYHQLTIFPRFLCTSSASSIIYRTINHFTETARFEIDDTNLAFFTRIDPNAAKGIYTPSNPEFFDYLGAMFKYADSFLNVIRWHATEEGRLSEQFNRYSGFQRGAKDLTWSYGSFIGAVEDRKAAKGGLLEVAGEAGRNVSVLV